MRARVFPPKTDAEIAAAEEQILELTKRIEFYITEYSVELLAQKLGAGDLVVPSYQREYTWEDERKSRFIESLVMGLPIPFLFFWEMPDGRLEIVDGSQRLRTIREFVVDGLRLTELESLTSLSGFTFNELPAARRRKINNRSIRGIVLNEHADEQARFDLFDRINTGSKIANTAEVRRGALAGPFMSLIGDLANLDLFKRLAPVTRAGEAQRDRDELVTRFFGYGDGLENYRDRPSEFLFNYVKEMNRQAGANPAILAQYRSRFIDVMTFIEGNFPHGFRKTSTATTTPRARFEAISVGSQLALREKPELAEGPVPPVAGWIQSQQFADVTGSDGANAIARLRGRIEYVKNKLTEN